MKIFGHPVHTMLVHFPIALWSLASICDGVAIFGYPDAWRASTWLMGIGLFIAVIAMIPGLIDLAKLPEDARVTGITHMSFMGLAWLFYLLSLVFHIDQGTISSAPNIWGLALGTVGFGCLSIGGYYGAELVYRHGAGRILDKSLG